MKKIITKTSEVALGDIKSAISELRNCQDEIRKGLISPVYVDLANKKLSNAIKHMLNAESWVDAIKDSQEPSHD